MVETMEITIGDSVKSGDTEIETVDTEPLEMADPGDTVFHETFHVFGAVYGDRIGANKVTIEPDSTSLGSMEPDSYSPTGTVAAHAMGAGGAGFDLWQMERRGDHPGAFAPTAVGIINNRFKEVIIFASVLQASKTMKRGQISRVLYLASNGRDIRIRTKNPYETKQTIKKVKYGEKLTVTINQIDPPLKKDPDDKKVIEDDKSKDLKEDKKFEPVGSLFFNRPSNEDLPLAA